MADLAGDLERLTEQRWFLPVVVGGGVGGVILLVRLMRRPAAAPAGPVDSAAPPEPDAGDGSGGLGGVAGALYQQYQSATQSSISGLQTSIEQGLATQDQARAAMQAAIEQKLTGAVSSWDSKLAPLGSAISVIQSKDALQDKEIARHTTEIGGLTSAVATINAKIAGIGNPAQPTPTPAPAPAPTPGGLSPHAERYTPDKWQELAAKIIRNGWAAGYVKGGPLGVNARLSFPNGVALYLPIPYYPSMDTYRAWVVGFGEETGLERIIRWTADAMALNADRDATPVFASKIKALATGNAGIGFDRAQALALPG